MTTALLFIAFGYFSGSILFAKITAKLFQKPAILQDSKDGNPGTANAFRYGGFWCGIITLLAVFAMVFILLSTVLRITPHFHRTLITYLFTLVGLFVCDCERSILFGFLIITLTVCLRLHMSKEEREKMIVKLLILSCRRWRS